MCKNHQGLQQKKEGICKIYYRWVTVITPDICQILQEKPNGKLKMVLFRMMRNNLFKFEASIRQNYVTSQKRVEISLCSGKIT